MTTIANASLVPQMFATTKEPALRNSATSVSCLHCQIHILCHFGLLQMAPMGAVRGSLGAVSLNGHIWAVGGGEPGVSLETVEMYDPVINAWMPGKHCDPDSLQKN